MKIPIFQYANSQKLNFPKSTIHRVLRTLSERLTIEEVTKICWKSGSCVGQESEEDAREEPKPFYSNSDSEDRNVVRICPKVKGTFRVEVIQGQKSSQPQ